MEVTLRVNDDCSPASDTYSLLRECVAYHTATTDRESVAGTLAVVDGYLSFNSKIRLHAILGLKAEVSGLDLGAGNVTVISVRSSK